MNPVLLGDAHVVRRVIDLFVPPRPAPRALSTIAAQLRGHDLQCDACQVRWNSCAGARCFCCGEPGTVS